MSHFAHNALLSWP